jgi:hypothetical protein
MKPNATLIIEFFNKTIKIPVEWKDNYFVNGAEVAEQIFFASSPAMDKNFMDGHPEMNVILNSNPKIKCQAIFEYIAGEIFPTRSLTKLLSKT